MIITIVTKRHYKINLMAWKLLNLYFISAALLSVALMVNSVQMQFPTFVIPHNGDSRSVIPRSCSASADAQAWQGISNIVSSILQEFVVPRMECGEGEWHRVAYLNMNEPSHQCPSAWREDSLHGIRVCK